MAVLLGALVAIAVVAVAVTALISLFKKTDTPAGEAENAEAIADAEASTETGENEPCANCEADDAEGGSADTSGPQWTPEDLKARLQRTDPEVIETLCNENTKVISFAGAQDEWEYDDGRTETVDLTNTLSGNTIRARRTEIGGVTLHEVPAEIRLNQQLPPEQAVLTLFHEYQHTQQDPGSNYLQNEIDARVDTEKFAIRQELPETRPGYRNADGTVNEEYITEQIHDSKHYNPQNRRRIGREYLGENETSGWCPP